MTEEEEREFWATHEMTEEYLSFASPDDSELLPPTRPRRRRSRPRSRSSLAPFVSASTWIQGMGPVDPTTLHDAGLRTIEALLEKGATPKGRDEIAAATGISGKLILRWVNHADLFRIKGVAGEYAELLEASGVDTVAELAQRNAANLAKAMAEKNEARKIVRRVPTETQVADWIAEAKSLPRKVTY